MVRIGEVAPGSVGEALEMRVGTRIIAVNGERVRDGLDFLFRTADGELELEAVDAEGRRTVYEIGGYDDRPLGMVPDRDKIRECANECVFCFIDGNPPDARAPLWLRDDDFRLSFTYGSYVTLTNLGPRGLERLVEQRISPLYVSVHATDPVVRSRMLKNPRAGLIMQQLRELLEGGVELHAQVVLCPGWNDGPELDRTIADLYRLGDGVLSLSVVPVGLTRYNVGRPVRLLDPDEARVAIGQTETVRRRARAERERNWCYAADELFLIADRNVPGAAYYDEGGLVENGVGALRELLDAFESGKGRLAPMAGVERVRVVTGASMEPYFAEMAAAVGAGMGCETEVVSVPNSYFGPTVTIAGLLAGTDIVEAVGDCRPGDLVLLPGAALSGEDVFIDGMPLVRVERSLAPATVRTGHELVEVLVGS
ncbi:MAG: DUF512 domain-containing protein [Gemmatimonadetes bacterium]|nr:DUF512 domain-containing protein [Gemmatimonadota bacterium]